MSLAPNYLSLRCITSRATPIDIELKVDLDLHEFSGSGITDYNSGLTNCAFHNNNGKWELTQRAAIDITEDASGITGLTDRARGIYYWEQESNLFIVNDDTVYEQTQDGGEVAGGSEISTGTERCTMLETIGTPRLVILDPENNEGWWVNTPASAVTAIASNFPTTLCHGGAILDGYLFVMDEDGIIYNSAVDDPTTFPATGFLEAERENDKGVYLGKHNEHIVAFGTRTMEFMYDAKNKAGSPLNRRDDVMHNIGCADGQGVWENGDITYFIGSNSTGELAIYKLENFQVTPISNGSLNSYLTQGLTQESLRIVLSGWSAMGQDMLVVTIYTLVGAAPGEISPKQTLSFNTLSGKFGFINTKVNGHTLFPLMAFTKRTGGQNATESARSGEGILYNGDILTVTDKMIPVDTVGATDGVYDEGVYDVDTYVASSSDVGTNIEAAIRTGDVDGGVRGFKFQNFEFVMMDNTQNSQTLTISHADGASTEFTVAGTVDTSLDKKELYSGGRFAQRNYQLEYAGDEQFFMSGYGADLEAGD